MLCEKTGRPDNKLHRDGPGRPFKLSAKIILHGNGTAAAGGLETPGIRCRAHQPAGLNTVRHVFQSIPPAFDKNFQAS